jgi:hypothetical protein
MAKIFGKPGFADKMSDKDAEKLATEAEKLTTEIVNDLKEKLTSESGVFRLTESQLKRTIAKKVAATVLGEDNVNEAVLGEIIGAIGDLNFKI